MTRLIKPIHTELIRRRYETCGHVGISRAFNPELGPEVTRQLSADPKFARTIVKAKSNFSAVKGYRPHRVRDSAVIQLLDAIDEVGDPLEDRHWRPWRKSELNVERIWMPPNGYGIKHLDLSELPSAIAVANVEGESSLVIEDGTTYDLGVGDIALMDPSSGLAHQGFSGPNGERTAFVVTLA